jgi:hypothetical protein
MNPSPCKRKNLSELIAGVEQEEGVAKAARTSDKQINEFYCILTQADLELYYCSMYKGQDAFTHRIYEGIDKKETWATTFGLLATCSQRESKDQPHPIRNVTPAKNGERYPRRYYVRAVDVSTPDNRRKGAEYLAKVRV